MFFKVDLYGTPYSQMHFTSSFRRKVLRALSWTIDQIVVTWSTVDGIAFAASGVKLLITFDIKFITSGFEENLVKLSQLHIIIQLILMNR